jgi:hypothetical protein
MKITRQCLENQDAIKGYVDTKMPTGSIISTNILSPNFKPMELNLLTHHVDVREKNKNIITTTK